MPVFALTGQTLQELRKCRSLPVYTVFDGDGVRQASFLTHGRTLRIALFAESV